jgi:DNA-binding LacI/PurR family transcriptional regulator
MGKWSAEMLMTMIETGDQVRSRIVPHTIVERKSVKSILQE